MRTIWALSPNFGDSVREEISSLSKNQGQCLDKHPIRVLKDAQGEPWLVARDVLDVLGTIMRLCVTFPPLRRAICLRLFDHL